MAAFWSPFSRVDLEGEAPDEPDWLEAIGGSPSLVEFHAEGYSIGGSKRA